MASPIVSPYMRMVKRSNECMGVLIEAGLDGDDLQAPVDNVDFREALISFWKARGQLDVAPVKESPSQQTARAIMGRNFLGIEDVQKRFDVTYTPEQLASLEQVPFTAEVLEECKDTHILFPGYPITILDIRQRTKKKAKKVFYADRDAWYNDQKFAKDEEVGLRWYLIRKDIVENSTSKTWDEQRKLLGPNEEVPQAAAVVYMIILYYLVTGIRLFERIYARCQDVTSFGSRVYVGRFGQGGLHVDSYWGDYRRSHIGLASSRK